MDDDFMAACFKDNIECTELVLRIVTGKSDLKVERVQTQYHIKNLQGRSVILDIYASDNCGRKINAEIQRSDKGQGLPIYHIDRTIKETGEYFGDEAHIIYVNGAYRDDTPLGILMQDFACTDPDKMQYQVLAERTRYFKQDKEGIRRMCKMMEDMRNEAALAEKKAMVRNLIVLGKLSYEEIAKCANMSVEEVEELTGQKRA